MKQTYHSNAVTNVHIRNDINGSKFRDIETAEISALFMNECLEFFPFEITHVLTDNGPEFTKRLIKSKKKYVTKNQ